MHSDGQRGNSIDASARITTPRSLLCSVCRYGRKIGQCTAKVTRVHRTSDSCIIVIEPYFRRVHNEEKCQLSSRYDFIASTQWTIDLRWRRSFPALTQTRMHRLGVLTAALLLVVIVSIDAYRENEKVCLRNLLINGTNLITNYRKQILVVGISHLGCQACRNQAVR